MEPMRPQTLVVATNNPHKLREFRRLFSGFSLSSPAQIGCTFSYEEGGGSYLENALGKALHLHELADYPVLADDSGLEVPALGGEPGIYSSRYGSPDGREKLSASERNDYLLRRAHGLGDRRCFFVCCMAVVLGGKRFVTVQETFHGVLAGSPRGTGGFGYDPLVYLPELGKTVAELDDQEKDAVSHRGKAARRMMSLLTGL